MKKPRIFRPARLPAGFLCLVAVVCCDGSKKLVPPDTSSVALEHLECEEDEASCGDPVARGQAEAQSDITHGVRSYFWIGELPDLGVAEDFEKRYGVKLEYTGCEVGSWDSRKGAAYNRVMRKHLGLAHDPLEGR